MLFDFSSDLCETLSSVWRLLAFDLMLVGFINFGMIAVPPGEKVVQVLSVMPVHPFWSSPWRIV